VFSEKVLVFYNDNDSTAWTDGYEKIIVNDDSNMVMTFTVQKQGFKSYSITGLVVIF